MADLLRSSVDSPSTQAISLSDNVSSFHPSISIADGGANPDGYVSNNDDWNSLSGELDDGTIPSVSEYIKDNPDSSYEDVMKYMAQYSDEWAEKLLDYYMSKDSIREANEYNASREDSAYQRLVADLKNAGLNPALMYAHGVSPTGSASSAVYDPSGSASSSRISNISKIKQLLISSILAQWQIEYQKTSNDLKGIDIIRKTFGLLLGLMDR